MSGSKASFPISDKTAAALRFSPRFSASLKYSPEILDSAFLMLPPS